LREILVRRVLTLFKRLDLRLHVQVLLRIWSDL